MRNQSAARPTGPINKSTSRPRPNLSSPKSQAGLTLIELMVAMTIGLFMLLAIALVYSTSKTGFSYTNNTVQMTEDGAFALDLIARDVRMASYAGCTGSNIRTAGTPPVSYYTPKLDLLAGQSVTGTARPNPFATTIANGVFNSENSILGFAANNSNVITELGGSASTYVVGTATSILYLAGGSSRALQISSPISAAADNISIPADTYSWNDPSSANSMFMIISDCKGSEVFRADSISTVAGVTQISHAATSNSSANFLNLYGSDAIVTPLTTSVYFLAKRAGAANSSLYRRNFNGRVANIEELIPNVEAIAFHYGINTSLTGAGLPTYMADAYKTNAATITDWTKVVSVRVGLIMVSEEAGKASVQGQVIAWIDGNYSPPNDFKLRRAYGTTVSIRNRMGL